jgi:predicted solute-binding protein
MCLSRSYDILKNGRLVIRKDLFKEVIDNFDENNFLFGSIQNTVRHFVNKKNYSYSISRKLDRKKIEKLKHLYRRKKLKSVEIYRPANKLFNYLSLIIALLMENYGLILI